METAEISFLNSRKHSAFRLLRFLYLIIISLLFVDCSSGILSQKQKEETPSEDDTIPLSDLKQRFDQLYQKIGNRDTLRQVYADLMKIQKVDTLHEWDQERAGELNFYLATYTQVSRDSSKMLYNRGREAASRLLQQFPSVNHYIQNGSENDTSAIPKMTNSSTVDAVYWWTINTLFWYSNETPIARLVARKKLERAIKYIEHNNPDYRFDAVNRLRGLLLTFSPDGDLNQAQQAFEQSISKAGNFVENRYMYARYYAVMLQDQQLFNVQMNKILAFSGKDPKGFKQLNTLVQARAADYLDEESGLFVGKMPVKVNGNRR